MPRFLFLKPFTLNFSDHSERESDFQCDSEGLTLCIEKSRTGVDNGAGYVFKNREDLGGQHIATFQVKIHAITVCKI
jgi:hypothetical protein